MRIESIGKYFSPKSTLISDSPRATASDSLDVSGVMAAIGVAYSQCGLGVELHLAKIGVSSPDKAVTMLVERAEGLANKCKPLSELSTDISERVVQILATFAYQDYSRSAASTRKCDCCNGSGFIDAEVFSTKTHMSAKNKKFVRASVMMGVDGFMPSEYEVRRDLREVVKVLCPSCKGKRVLSNSCRCHGKGRVIDKDKTAKFGGVPVWKPCERCQERGYARLKFSTVLDGVRTVWDVKKTTAYDHLQPFFESLVSECHMAESYADIVLSRVTK